MLQLPLHRNSGATLTPCLYKTGGAAIVAQGAKMQFYPSVFVPVLSATARGYSMLMLREASDSDVVLALQRLRWLWYTPESPPLLANRFAYHAYVRALAQDTPLEPTLAQWFERFDGFNGQPAYAVHGDATLENIVEDGLWIDPSTRPVPLEAELDGGKLLQSYFGYGEGRTAARLGMVRRFLLEEQLDLDLCAYYLVTHLARLYKLQPQAQQWAVELATSLEQRMEAFKNDAVGAQYSDLQ